MSHNPHIRSKSIHNAMQLMQHHDPMHAMAQMMAIAHVLESYEEGRDLVATTEDAPTAEAPKEPEVQHTEAAATPAVPAQQAEVVEAMQTVGDRIKKAVSRKKAPAKKANGKKTKSAREAAREPVPTESHEIGNTLPVEGSPVPNGAGTEADQSIAA